MVFHGSELSMGIILAAWLAWVGVGSRLGAIFAERSNHPVQLLALTAAGIALTTPATIGFIRGVRSFFDVLPGAYLSLQDMAISSFLLMAPTCLLIGMQFVLLSKVWRENDHKGDTTGTAKTYVGEAVGNMFGGIIFTFLMVRNLNAVQSAVIIALLMPATLLLITRKSLSTPRRFRWLLWAILGFSLLILPFSDALNSWAHRMQWQIFSPQHQLVGTHQSKYGTISILQRERQFSFFQSGHLIFSTAGPEAADPGLENQDAIIFAHFSMVQHEAPKRILLIGGGLRGVLSEIAKHPVEQIDYIELDEVLTKVAKPFLPTKNLQTLADQRVRLIHTDGRLFVKTAQSKYDMIIVDIPDPATAVLNRFYTQEFFREAEALLYPGGVLVIGATSTPDLRSLAIANRNSTLYHTLATVFERVDVAGEQFLLYFATNSPGQVSLDAPTLKGRYQARNIQTEGFSGEHFYTLLQEAQLRRVNWIVHHHGRSDNAHLEGPGAVPLVLADNFEQEQAKTTLAPLIPRYFINSDFRLIGYYYTVMHLEDLTRAGQGELLKRLLAFQPEWALLLFGLPLLVTTGLRIATRRHRERVDSNFAVHFSVFTTGFSSMALQIALIFSFQSIYGFVYEIIGVIVAIFMLGLALGAFFTNKYIANKATLNTLAKIQLLTAFFAGGIGFILPGAAGIPSPAIIFILFSTLTFISGVINGVNFPLAAACTMRLTKRADKSAGIVYSLEVFGACIGATLASVLMAPIWGVSACCWIASIANGAAFVTLMIARRS